MDLRAELLALVDCLAPIPVDMSPEGIDRRIGDLAALYDLGESPRRGRWVGSVEETDEAEAFRDGPVTE